MSKEKFYITTAIAYTSKKPHIGNTYEIVLTDAIARFNRFIGKDVFFLTGTDEHGQNCLLCTSGGDQQIGSRIAYNEIDLVLFFRDPLNAEGYEPDVFSLLRLCDMHNIPIATNCATAEVLIHGLERGDLDWRDIVNPKN